MEFPRQMVLTAPSCSTALIFIFNMMKTPTTNYFVFPSATTYMAPEQLAYFSGLLGAEREHLLHSAYQTVEELHKLEKMADPSDRATQEEDHTLELKVRDRERKHLHKIDDALARIRDGSYGWCAETGEEIGLPRMLARPTAIFSFEVQQRHERINKLLRSE